MLWLDVVLYPISLYFSMYELTRLLKHIQGVDAGWSCSPIPFTSWAHMYRFLWHRFSIFVALLHADVFYMGVEG